MIGRNTSLSFPTISCILDVDTGQASTEDMTSPCEGMEIVLEQYSGPTIENEYDLNTGEHYSMTSRVHRYGGGFAVTDICAHEYSMPIDDTAPYLNTEVHLQGNAISHEFVLREDEESHSRRRGQNLPNNCFNTSEATGSFVDDDLVLTNTPMIARAAPRSVNRRTKRSKDIQPRLSESELLAKTVDLFKERVQFLARPNGANPHLRVHHLFRKGRTIAFASAYLSSRTGQKALVSVMWQTKKSPKWAVCVTFMLPETSNDVLAYCTCDHLSGQRKGGDHNCEHTQSLFENEQFITYITTSIRGRQRQRNPSRERCIFGDCINLEALEDKWHYLTAFLDRGEHSFPRQAKPWMFFIVLDVSMQIFVPLIKTSGKALQCMLCRTNSTKRGTCAHEEACLTACKNVRNSENLPRLLSRVGIEWDGDLSDDTHPDDAEDSSADEEGGNDGNEDLNEDLEAGEHPNQSVRVPECYYPEGFKRPILPCPGEIRYMKVLAEALQNLPEGERLSIDEKDSACCHVCGALNNTSRCPGYARDVQLHTLSQGTHEITVYDWFCDVCKEERKFSGRTSGIFPARKKSCYTTELLYVLLEMSCMNSLSFRTAYKVTRLFSRSPSVTMHWRNTDNPANPSQDKKSRRQANDAFRAFVEHLDTSSKMITNNLFSCTNCEVSLSKRDCEELGISEEDARGKKRLKAIVIDGTAAGTLTKLPEFEREISVVPPASGLGSVTLVSTPRHRKVIRKLLNMTRASLRDWKRNQRSSRTRSHDAALRFWIRNPCNAKVPPIQDNKESLTEMEIHLIRLYLSEDHCFCDASIRNENTSVQHRGSCGQLRKHFEKTKADGEIGCILRQVYEISEHALLQSAENDSTNSPDSGELEHLGETENPSNRTNLTTGATERINCYSADLILRDINRNPQFTESLISVIDFLLNEHISLPYIGRTSAGTPQITSGGGGTGGSIVENGSSSVTESTPNASSGNEGDHQGSNNAEEDPDCTKAMLSFKDNTFKLHEDICFSIDEYTTCLHFLTEGTPQTVPVECPCVRRLKSATIAINESNPLLGAFIQEFLKLKRPLETIHCCIATSLIDLLKIHKERANDFFLELGSELPEQCIDYYKAYGVFKNLETTSASDLSQGLTQNRHQSSTADNAIQHNEIQEQSNENNQNLNQTNDNQTEAEQNEGEHESAVDDDNVELQQSKDSGICFPGRLKRRPCIVFKTEDKQSCSKKYSVSRSHTPGLLTVQCACDSPKLQGFIIMTQSESTALALSSILTHFEIPPRSVFYDNACNLFTSTLLRTPWLLGNTRLAVDRFHYKAHKCSAYFNPDSYRQFDTLRTEAAESINARIQKNINTIRYLNGERLITFLRTRFALLNLASCFKQNFIRSDIEDVNLNEFFHKLYKCECDGCKELESKIPIVTTTDSGAGE